MEPSFEDVLNLSTFEDVELEIYSLYNLEDVHVRAVHPSELPDIASFLKGGEVLLTAGIGMGTGEAEQVVYLDRLAEVGVVGIVLEESGRVFEEVPGSLIDHATSLGLTVVTLKGEIPFAAVITEFHEMINNRRLLQFANDAEFQDRLNEILSHGGDSIELLEALQNHLGGIAVLENRLHGIAALTGPTDSAFVNNWPDHARAHHGNQGECLRQPVLMKGQPWGWVHSLNYPKMDPEMERIAVERTSIAITISMLSERTRQVQRQSRGTALLTRLVLGDLSGDQFLVRARRLGFDPGQGMLTVMAVQGESEVPSIEAPVGASVLLAQYKDALFAIAPTEQIDPLKALILEAAPGERIGQSRSVTADSLTAAVRQARSAAAFADRGMNSSRIVTFDSLGVERLLVALQDTPDLISYVEDELSNLLDHDSRTANPLMPTLKAFLSADGNKSQSADELHIQRRTLYNRLDRISKILKRDLDAPADRQRLHLAIRGLDLLAGL